MLTVRHSQAPDLAAARRRLETNPNLLRLHWILGYPFALLLMAAVCAGLYLIFKRRGWL